MKLPTEGRHTQPGWENGAQGTGGKVGASLQDELWKRVGWQPLGLCGPTVPVPVLLLATLPNQ